MRPSAPVSPKYSKPAAQVHRLIRCARIRQLACLHHVDLPDSSRADGLLLRQTGMTADAQISVLSWVDGPENIRRRLVALALLVSMRTARRHRKSIGPLDASAICSAGSGCCAAEWETARGVAVVMAYISLKQLCACHTSFASVARVPPLAAGAGPLWLPGVGAHFPAAGLHPGHRLRQHRHPHVGCCSRLHDSGHGMLECHTLQLCEDAMSSDSWWRCRYAYKWQWRPGELPKLHAVPPKAARHKCEHLSLPATVAWAHFSGGAVMARGLQGQDGRKGTGGSSQKALCILAMQCRARQGPGAHTIGWRQSPVCTPCMRILRVRPSGLQASLMLLPQL
jgi:hypothetical protein